MGSTEIVRARSLGPAILALALALTAHAQMRFYVPDGCGSELDFRSELERLLDGRARVLLPSALIIGPPDASGEHTLRLELAGQTRVLRDHDCPTLLRSAVVITAAAARELPPPPPPEPEPAPPPEPVPVNVPVPVPAARESTPLLGSLQLGAGVSSGIVPGLTPPLLAGASLEPAPFGAALSLRYALPGDEQREGRAVDVDSLGVRVEGLYRVVPALELALGVEADWLHGSGARGVSGRQASSVWRFAPTLGLSVIPWPDAQPRLELGLSAQLALVRPRFVVEGFGDVYRVPVAGVDAIIRGAWLFR
jgi:hypothetical protein